MREGRRALLAAQHRVCRPWRGPSQLGTRDPTHPRIQAGLLEDRFRKLGPRRIAFSGDVPDAERSLQQLTRRGCQMADVGRSGALVVDDSDLVALARKVEHRPDKVRPGRAVEP